MNRKTLLLPQEGEEYFSSVAKSSLTERRRVHLLLLILTRSVTIITDFPFFNILGCSFLAVKAALIYTAGSLWKAFFHPNFPEYDT